MMLGLGQNSQMVRPPQMNSVCQQLHLQEELFSTEDICALRKFQPVVLSSGA